MKKPQVRIWIDAKNEILDQGQHAEEVFIIDGLEQKDRKKLLIETLFPLVKEVILLDSPPNAVKVTYNPTRVSLGFIKYCLCQRNLLAQEGKG